MFEGFFFLLKTTSFQEKEKKNLQWKIHYNEKKICNVLASPAL